MESDALLPRWLSDPELLAHLPERINFDTFVEDLRARLGPILPFKAELYHHFCPGIYVREYRAKAGTIDMSRVHLTVHPYAVTMGAVVVWTRDGQRDLLRAPYFGITTEGTQRVLLVVEDLVWMTFHANPDDCHDPDEIVRRVTAEVNPT